MSEKEYIERGALLKQKRYISLDRYETECVIDVDKVIDAPAADVVEVVHGEWKQATEPLGCHDVDCVLCSACGESWILDEDFDFDVVKDFWNYCPNCGADMRGVIDGKE